MLGEGSYEFVIADRGGLGRLGVIDRFESAVITRPKDDTGTLRMNIFPKAADCRSLLADARCVRNELVVYRDGVRFWEGPITRIAYYRDRVEMDASDVSWYLSRTALRENVDFTGVSVNAVDFLYNIIRRHFPDPDVFNIGAFVAKVNSTDDARTAANFPAYSRTLFELLDKYAEDGGIDYIVNGRMILIYDTHCRAHVLPRLSESDFQSDLGVVEYGTELATRTISSNSAGSYSTATAPAEWIDYYGNIDKVITSTQEAGSAAVTALQSQAERELYAGYPAPVDILVPANSRLDPCSGVDMSMLLPGGWVPIDSRDTMRQVSQWQRIAEVKIEVSPEGESVLLSLQQPPAKVVEPTRPVAMEGML